MGEWKHRRQGEREQGREGARGKWHLRSPSPALPFSTPGVHFSCEIVRGAIHCSTLGGSMQYRPLGKTGYQVFPIGLGCAPMMTLSLATGTRLVRRAIELGLNYIDTAHGYGETEVMVGQALQGQREKVFLSTKTFGANARRCMARNTGLIATPADGLPGQLSPARVERRRGYGTPAGVGRRTGGAGGSAPGRVDPSHRLHGAHQPRADTGAEALRL